MQFYILNFRVHKFYKIYNLNEFKDNFGIKKFMEV